MIELFFSLSEEELASMMEYNPRIIHTMCIGLSLEFNEIENEKNISNRGMLH